MPSHPCLLLTRMAPIPMHTSVTVFPRAASDTVSLSEVGLSLRLDCAGAWSFGACSERVSVSRSKAQRLLQLLPYFTMRR